MTVEDEHVFLGGFGLQPSGATTPTDGAKPKDSSTDDPLSHRFEYMQWAPVIRKLYATLVENADNTKVPVVGDAIESQTSPRLSVAERLAAYRRKTAKPADEKYRFFEGVTELVDALALVKTGELLKEKPDAITVTLGTGNRQYVTDEVNFLSGVLTGEKAPYRRDGTFIPQVDMEGFGLRVAFGSTEVAQTPGRFVAIATVSRLPKDLGPAAATRRKA